MQVHQIQCGPLQCNCYLIEENGTVVLIDCGGTGSEILSFAKEKGWMIDAILLTHGHIDHIEGVDRVVADHQCPVYIHEDDAAFLQNANFNLSAKIYRIPFALEISAIPFKDNERLKFKAMEFDVIHTPGHTPGSVCFRFGEILFTGDTLFLNSVGNEFPPFGSFSLEIESIRTRLFALDGDFVCYPGHGERTMLDYEKMNNPYCRV